MADINVIESDTGQTVVKDTTNVTVAEIQYLNSMPSLPAEFDHMIRIAAANGGKMLASISHTLMLADAISAVNTARADIVAWATTAINNLQTSKQDKLTGTASQYVKGDGTYGTLPSPVDISGKSDKSQFAALSTLAAHGRSNGATNNPTNSPTDAPTNYGLIAAILGADANSTNA